jgi:hypothetical protein
VPELPTVAVAPDAVSLPAADTDAEVASWLRNALRNAVRLFGALCGVLELTLPLLGLLELAPSSALRKLARSLEPVLLPPRPASSGFWLCETLEAPVVEPPVVEAGGQRLTFVVSALIMGQASLQGEEGFRSR